MGTPLVMPARYSYSMVQTNVCVVLLVFVLLSLSFSFSTPCARRLGKVDGTRKTGNLLQKKKPRRVHSRYSELGGEGVCVWGVIPAPGKCPAFHRGSDVATETEYGM